MVEHNALWEDYFSSYRKIASTHRTPGLFKWLYNSYKNLYLSCVPSSDIYKLANLKAGLAIVDTAVDDACDNASLIEKNGGDIFSYEMLNLLYNADKIASGGYMHLYPSTGNNIYANTTLNIFSDLLGTQIISLPRYNEFKGEFFLAMHNVAGSMEFSYLVNRNKIAYPYDLVIQNKGPSTMVEVLSILDLMDSESFDAAELGKAIALFRMADIVAMLNNAVNTWKKEIIERDYSSPVISLALERKLIKFSDFDTVNAKYIEENLSPLPEIINEELNSFIEAMKEFVEKYEIKSFDALKYINNYKTYAFKSQRKNEEVCKKRMA